MASEDQPQSLREIIQPDLAWPTGEPLYVWAAEARMIDAWMRAVAPQLGLDSAKLIKGYVINTILRDDNSSFGALSAIQPEDRKLFAEAEYQDLADTSKNALLERLDWEICVPEIDEELCRRLVQVKNLVKSTDWNHEQDFQAPVQKWTTEVYAWLAKRLAGNPDVKEAVSYYGDLWNSPNSQLRQAYLEFTDRAKIQR